jgi:sugar lactone lactonase YvrE
MTDILAPEVVCELGEGPLWADGMLYWFDILGKRLHACAAAGDGRRNWQFNEHFSAAGRIAGGLILASESALWRFEPETGSRTHLVALEADRPETRSNDGRADRQGGFWIGTMGKTGHMAENGALYRYHRGELRRLRTGVAIPNAICFAPDGRRGYFADSKNSTKYFQKLTHS